MLGTSVFVCLGHMPLGRWVEFFEDYAVRAARDYPILPFDPMTEPDVGPNLDYTYHNNLM